MATYQLFHPDTEILGQVILDFEQAVNSDNFMKVFEKHHLTNVEAEQWYPAQLWVDALNEIANSPSSMLDLVSIGISQLELAVMPPEFDQMSITEILQAIEEAYQMNYRGTDIGSISVDVLNDRHVELTVRSFEPDDLWYGNIHGLMRRYTPKGTHYKVYYDTEQPRREEGGDTTILHVEW